MMIIESFRPSKHGFHFNNDFPSQPDVKIDIPIIGEIGLGDASNGLCGGMVYAVLDYYLGNISIPQDATPPNNDTELFHFMLHRLWDSFSLPWGILKYYRWMSISDPDVLITKTLIEIKKLKRQLITRPVPIGLIRQYSANPLDLGSNHQVLIYEIHECPDDGNRIYMIYDPNYADKDDCSLTITDNKLIHSEDGEQRGFFVSNYVQHNV